MVPWYEKRKRVKLQTARKHGIPIENLKWVNGTLHDTRGETPVPMEDVDRIPKIKLGAKPRRPREVTTVMPVPTPDTRPNNGRHLEDRLVPPGTRVKGYKRALPHRADLGRRRPIVHR